MTSIFQHYKHKSFYSLPYYNSIQNIIEVDTYLIILVYEEFSCIFDTKDYSLTIIDNFDGEFKKMFLCNDKTFILTSNTLIELSLNNKSYIHLDDYNDYDLYKSHIVFFHNNYNEITIYNIELNEIIFSLKDIEFSYITTLFEDRILDKIFLYVIYSTIKHKHIYKYDINNKTHEYFSFKSTIPFSIVYNIDDKHLFIKNSCFSFLYDELHSQNKFQMCFLNDVFEIYYMDEINCIFFRSLYKCFIIHKSKFIKVKNSSLSNLQSLIDNSDLEYCFYFDYDSCKPYFCFKNNIIIFIFKHHLFIYSLLPDFQFLSMKEINYYSTFNSICVGNISNNIYLTTSDGDFYTFNL